MWGIEPFIYGYPKPKTQHPYPKNSKRLESPLTLRRCEVFVALFVLPLLGFSLVNTLSLGLLNSRASFFMDQSVLGFGAVFVEPSAFHTLTRLRRCRITGRNLQECASVRNFRPAAVSLFCSNLYSFSSYSIRHPHICC